jgi:glycosyltransferase involved in cell wall biosynthesis
MRVISSIINDISTDQRVMKQAAVLKTLGCNVTIVCRRRSPGKIYPTHFKAVRLRFLINSGPLFYFLYNLRLLFYLLVSRSDIYVANDLDTLIPCYIVAKLRRKPLVYDSHEYFTGQYGLEGKRISYGIWKMIERSIVPRLKYMITVSDSIADLYHKEYGVSPVVVRNVAYSSSEIISADRENFGIGDEELLVVLQGAGINPGRGAVEMLDALKLVSGVHLLIIGSGDAMNDIKKKVSTLELNEKVTFLPQMPWTEMMKYTKACDAGLSLDKDSCLNQRYSLPNKLFDYLSAGIPVVASPLPEISKIIKEFNCGIITDEVSATSISETLIKLRDDRALLLTLKKGAIKASEILTWEMESIKETSFFREITDKSQMH